MNMYQGMPQSHPFSIYLKSEEHSGSTKEYEGLNNSWFRCECGMMIPSVQERKEHQKNWSFLPLVPSDILKDVKEINMDPCCHRQHLRPGSLIWEKILETLYNVETLRKIQEEYQTRGARAAYLPHPGTRNS